LPKESAKFSTKDRRNFFVTAGVVSKIKSLNNLCKCLGFLDDKLTYLGINQLPASSTLSDANRKRSSEVFSHIYIWIIRKDQTKIEEIKATKKSDWRIDRR
jgi:hypothetical protein